MTLEITTVDPSWLADHRDDVAVVDVREPREYASLGHVPGAVNVPFGEVRDRSGDAAGMFPDAGTVERLLGAAGISPEDDVVAYDGKRGVEAARFLVTLAVYGHPGDLALLDGDVETWQRIYEMTTATPERAVTEYDAAALCENVLADLSDVESAIESDDVVLVDTRTPTEYEQAHLPGAVQVSWEAFVDDETGRLKSESQRRAILAANDIEPDDEIVLYCNTARRLSHTSVVLATLGYGNVSFYEGSLTGWMRANSPKWNPRQLYEDVRAVAPRGFDALPEELGADVFGRLHLVGLYTVRQPGYFMLRTKIPGGRLTAEQARTLGEIADEFATAPDEYGGSDQNPIFGDGFLDITTRQGVQMHWIETEDVPDIWDRYEAVGLTTIQASGNTLRNVVTCPAAGLADETIDVRHLAADVADAFEGSQRYANLPRKFKVSLSGCHENCGRAEVQDLGFTPAIRDGRDGFAVKVGGGLSDGPRAATDLGIFVEPDQVTELALAVGDLFIAHGRYLDTAVNRLKYIVAEWGIDRFREELATYVPFEFKPYDEALTTTYRGDHVGVHRQDNDHYYVGLNVPTGRMHGRDLVELATIADRYGGGELRTTANQNLLIPNVRGDALATLRDEPLLDEYSLDPGPFSRGIVTCTGREFCKYGVIETKSRCYRWGTVLDEWLETDDRLADVNVPEAIRIHVSGCSASCAQPQIGDVGMRGEAYRDENRSTQAVDIGLGGDLENGRFLDWIFGRVPVEDIPGAIQRVLFRFLKEREDDESFAVWTQRNGGDRLDRILTDSRQLVEAE